MKSSLAGPKVRPPAERCIYRLSNGISYTESWKHREARMGSKAAAGILSMLSEVAVQSTNSLYLARQGIKIW